MKKSAFVLFAAIMISSGIFAQDISEDGHLTAAHDGTPGGIVIITDDVPLPDTPDYTCDLRMQVGGIEFGDFDRDGDLDLAVGCYHSQSYPPYDDWRNFVLTNNNGQLESSPSWWSADMRSTTDVRWADFNGDNYPDLFACNGDFSFDNSVIYFGSYNGLAANPGWLANDNTWTLCAAPFDYDDDGDIDVATANQGANDDPFRPIYIYVNDGSGLPTTPSWQSNDQMITNFLKWGDMTGDGWYELAASKWVNFQSAVYGNNEGVITGSPVWTSGSTRGDKGIGWADIDGDYYPELAIGATQPTWLFDNTEGQLGQTPIWESNNSFHGCQDLAWGDIDGDGDPDLATVHFSTGSLRLYLNVNGVLESSPSWEYDGNASGTALAFGDVNGDGMLDLAMGQSGTPSVLVFLNTLQTAVDPELQQPKENSLSLNYPNPFNSSTAIRLELAESGPVSLEIFDLLGRRVEVLADYNLSAGIHDFIWDAKNRPSGIYYCRMVTSGRIETRRLALLK